MAKADPEVDLKLDARLDPDEELNRACDRLEAELPDRIARALSWLRGDRAKAVRIPIGLLFIGASFFWFLPVVGIEFLPIGLLLIAQDVPFLKRPIARMLMWLLRKWAALKQWWRGG